MALIGALVGCYLLGSLPTAYLLVKWTKRVDIRAIGSGNVGATNALRTAGLWAGVVVLVVDVLKGVIAARVIPFWLLRSTDPAAQLACGLITVVGHTYSCWLRFQGGKGVATTIGVLLGAAPLIAAGVVGVWVITFALCRYVSVGSLAAAAAIPVMQIIGHRPVGEVVLGAIMTGLITVRHRSNLQRLLSGAEHRAWSRR